MTSANHKKTGPEILKTHPFQHAISHNEDGGRPNNWLTPSIVVQNFCPKLVVLGDNYYVKTTLLADSSTQIK
jgi:hypothetical protein